MGTTVSIALHAAETTIPRAFQHLVQRMLLQGAGPRVYFYERFGYEDPHDLGIDALTRLEAVATSIVTSHRAIRVEMVYTLASGRGIVLDLNLYGKEFNLGWDVCYDGHIRLTLGLKPLSRPLKDALDDEPSPPQARLADLAEHVIMDSEALFFHACGAHDPTADIQHGAMYLECGWPSAEGCAMVYHRAAPEFARDFARIYAHYHWGISTPLLLERDVWQFQETDMAALRTYEPLEEAARKQPDRDIFADHEQLAFFSALDQETAQRLSALPAERIRALLHEVYQHEPELTCYDFGAQGLALTADPLSNVWRAYAYLGRAAPL